MGDSVPQSIGVTALPDLRVDSQPPTALSVRTVDVAVTVFVLL